MEGGNVSTEYYPGRFRAIGSKCKVSGVTSFKLNIWMTFCQTGENLPLHAAARNQPKRLAEPELDLVHHHHRHHHVPFPLREIGPCVLSLQASRSFAQLPASVQPLNPSSPRSLFTVLRHVSFGLPLLRLPSGVHVKAILVFSFTRSLSTCPISFQRLRFICWVISSIFVLNLKDLVQLLIKCRPSKT